MRTIHVYRAARNYFVDGIYWGDDAEGVRFYLRVTGANRVRTLFTSVRN